MDSSWRSFSLLFVSSSLIFLHVYGATDSLNVGQSIRDGETMVSPGGRFELGFFSSGNSRARYLGMWYRNLPVRTVLWIANRENPLTNTSGGVLQVIESGLLVLVNDTNGTVWSTNTSRPVRSPVAQLLDTGNLIVRNANDDRSENFLWQSFDYPTDTILAGMKIGWNLVTGLETFFVSWRNKDDPSPGWYSTHLDRTGYPQILLKRNGTVYHRMGPWNGIRFSGTPNIREDPTYRLTFVMNENEVTYREDAIDRSVVMKLSLDYNGLAQRLTWVDRGWVSYMNVPSDFCDTYRLCGAYASCNIGNSPYCGCLKRFVPRDPEGWARANWSSGCIRRSNLRCEGDVFIKYSGMKLPDATYSWHNTSMTLKECGLQCLRNCSCVAYTQLDIRRRIGCMIWYDDLVDMRSLSPDGQDIYIRMDASEADSEGKRREIVIASLASVIGAVLICLSLFLCIRKRRNYLQKKKEGKHNGMHDDGSELPLIDLFLITKATDHFSNKNKLGLCIRKRRNYLQKKKEGKHNGMHDDGSELPLIDLFLITKATDHFSNKNKLGEGGFGPVYKGILEEGQEIAVKRLSKDSAQGLNEFKNEVIFIAKLQHRNLVRLLGCCIQGDENMLVYEYMPNKSLDVFLFDQTKSKLLDWKMRLNIINGVARGLLYLHQDSRLRIIHRDLKASNILLDSEMNPKILDFGMARCFGGNETEAKTRRVVGTYGYMSPEYAVDGLFSVKSDVFSFGVLVLEIVSGRRNRGFYHDDHHLNLLGHAWTLYKEGRSLELVDASLGDSFYSPEVLRSINVGLLCVQQNPEDRPTMSSVVLMLSNEGVLPEAKEPGFFTRRDVLARFSSTGANAVNSTNEATITMLEPR